MKLHQPIQYQVHLLIARGNIEKTWETKSNVYFVIETNLQRNPRWSREQNVQREFYPKSSELQRLHV